MHMTGLTNPRDFGHLGCSAAGLRCYAAALAIELGYRAWLLSLVIELGYRERKAGLEGKEPESAEPPVTAITIVRAQRHFISRHPIVMLYLGK